MKEELKKMIDHYKTYVLETSSSDYKDIRTGEGEDPVSWQLENLVQECRKIEINVIEPLEEVLSFIEKNEKL